MYQNVKEFIESKIELIETNQFELLYELAENNFSHSLTIGNLTTTLLEAGINPLDYMTYKIPRSYLSGQDISDFKIPNTIELIGNGAFSYCDNLKRVELPDSVRMIGTFTFSGNTFEFFKLSKNIELIGPRAFAQTDCPILVYPGTVKEFKKTKLHLNNIRSKQWRKDSNIQIIRCADADLSLEY